MERSEEERRRQEAIRLFQEGVRVSEICRRLEASRPWFYKWLKRYRSGERNWYENRSRRPLSIRNKTPLKREKQVVEIRHRLENRKYSQRGAMAIQWEMEKDGLKPLPAWTINRILKRHQLVQTKKKYRPKGKKYPDLKSTFSKSIQQADFVGPRHLRQDGLFYSLNVIDLESYLAAINPCRTKANSQVAESLLRTWKTIGKPEFLQLDNELSFRSSNRYPHSLGLVIRVCLALGIQPIFIPIREPWRNGAVEKLQDVFDKIFFRRQYFEDYQELRREAQIFERFRNENHRCSAIKGQVPIEFVREKELTLDRLPADLKLSDIDLSLHEGQVHLIRFIRSDRLLDIFGEKFQLPESAQYEYVVATICTETQKLNVKLTGETVCSLDYEIPISYQRKC